MSRLNKNISIILPCYNASKTLDKTLESISNQSFKNFELIIIDDGSTDLTLTLIKTFEAKNLCDVKIISRENKGFLPSLEEGISIAQGTYIARIDADDIWLPNHLELLMHQFSIDNELVLVGSQAIKIDEEGKHIGMYNVPTKHTAVIKHMHKDNPFIHSSVIFKKGIYQKTNGYLIGSDELSKHIADYNLWFELSQYGTCKNIDQATIYYRFLENSMSRLMDNCTNYKARQLVMRKVYKYYKKHPMYSFIFLMRVKLQLLLQCKKGNF